MSVAFRRDSDEEHLEPKFELPVPAGPNLVTRRGLDLIAARVAELEAAIARASEEERVALIRDLRYWHTRQTTAQVTAAPADGSAGFGCRVAVRMNGSSRDVVIVGSDEADPATGRVGFQAPLARAIMGAFAGEQVAFAGREIDVLSVEAIDGEG